MRATIAGTFGEAPDSYADELALLNRVRQDALRGQAGSDATARDLLYKYYGQLELLELRFPDVRVPFPWHDAFTGRQISQLSLAYEKASVIFNIGATMSALGAQSPRSSPDSLKRAYHSLRVAAGMFAYINDNFLHAPSTDLSREVIKTLVAVMLAQATEVFVETMPEKASPGLRAKVCMQAAHLYSTAVDDVRENVSKGVFSRDWVHYVQCKHRLFVARAHRLRAQADQAASKHGLALAHMNVAETAAKDASRFAASFAAATSATATTRNFAPDAATALVELCKAALAQTSEQREQAQKDNDFVFNDLVPQESALPTIDRQAVAEPIPVHEVYASPDVQKLVGQDIFARLIPLSVHESASLYSEEKAKVVRAQAEKCDIADGELSTALEYMGLPASLDRFRRSSAAPYADPGPSVRGWRDELRTREYEGKVADMLAQLRSTREATRSQLERISADLEQESRECERMRIKYAHLWRQQPSSQLTKSWRDDVRSHRDNLAAAAASDDQIEHIWRSVQPDVEALLNDNKLEQLFFAASADTADRSTNLLDDDSNDDDQQMAAQANEISDMLARLHKVKKERLDVLKDLKERVQSDDISHLLILNRKSTPDPSLFTRELEKFRAHESRLAATVQRQQGMLAEVSAKYRSLTEGKRAREVAGQWARADGRRRELESRLGRARDGYAQVRDALTRGLSFYRDLGELVRALDAQVSRFVATRTRERDEMASSAEIQQRLDGGPSSPVDSMANRFDSMRFDSVSPSSTAPSPYPSFSGAPPRPPPASSPPQSMGSPYNSFSSPPPAMPQSYLPPPPAAPTASSYAYGQPPVPRPAQRQPSSSLPPPPPPPNYQYRPAY